MDSDLESRLALARDEFGFVFRDASTETQDGGFVRFTPISKFLENFSVSELRDPQIVRLLMLFALEAIVQKSRSKDA